LEPQFQLEFNGQQVQQQDINLLGEVSGLADDRVFAELLRMTPFGALVSKGILPYGHATSATEALVAPNGGTGSVLVRPFRAFVGSRTAAGTDARANWRDIRSGLSVAEGATSLDTTLNLAANASGDPRWDLVYAVVTVDALSSAIERKIKDVNTKVVNSQNVVVYKTTTVTLQVLQGTPAASPVWPTIPNDSGSTYKIPIAYVRIPNGFTSGSTVLTTDIAVQAPILRVGIGGRGVSPASSHYTVSTSEQQSWGSTGTRKLAWIPPDLAAAETMLVALDVTDFNPANWSHQNNSVIDDRDWRGRIARTTLSANADTTPFADCPFPWNVTELPSSGFYVPNANSTVNYTSHAVGSTLVPQQSTTRSTVVSWDNGSGWGVGLYVDHADSGKLKVSITGTPGSSFLFVIDWFGPYTNK
jgi:hypothetical protein